MRQQPLNFFSLFCSRSVWVSGSGVNKSFWLAGSGVDLSVWVSGSAVELRVLVYGSGVESSVLSLQVWRYVECFSLQIRSRSECFSLWIRRLKLKLVVKVSSVCFRIFPLHSLAETRKFPLLPSQPQVKLYKFSNSSPLYSRLWPSCQSNLPAPPLKGRTSSAMPF